MVTFTPAVIPPGIPKWKATILVDGNGAIFAPAFLWPSGELRGVAAASQDCEKMVTHANHPFVRLAWLVRRCPGEMGDWRAIEAIAQRHAEGDPNA